MSTRAPIIIGGVVPWPDEAARRYRQGGYWPGRSLVSYIAEQVQSRPEAEALVDAPTRLTYRQLWDHAASCAQTLLDMGLRPSDRIVVQLSNCWEFIALILGCFRIGVIPVMALPAHRRHEITQLAALSQARALVVDSSTADMDLREMAQRVAGDVASVSAVLIVGDIDGEPSPGHPECVPEYPLSAAMFTMPTFDGAEYEPAGADILCMLLSGGTTGVPKLIARTNDDYICNILCCNDITRVTADAVFLVALPASHNFPLACPGILGVLFVGGRAVMLPTPSPERALRTIDAENVTITAAVPAVTQRWIEVQRDHHVKRGSSLQVLQVGGARMPDELAARVRPVLGARLQQVFGMAEGLINMTRLDDDLDVILTTQGRPVCDADEIAIVDAAGQPVPDGTPGELLTRGPYTPRGYFAAPEHNARAFTADGWYASGDVVIRRPDGNLVVEGRAKDMINRGGEKISAEEIENFAYQLTAVDLAAAVAMPDPVVGERVCLYLTVLAGDPPTLADILAVMDAAGAAKFKQPERLVIIEKMPTTKVGKIDKKALRDDIARRLGREGVHP